MESVPPAVAGGCEAYSVPFAVADGLDSRCAALYSMTGPTRKNGARLEAIRLPEWY
jgi:hypothetical protein